jgi:hypothetical protein
MNPKKIQTIMEWRKPKTIRNVQCFLGFVNFYQVFIQDYSKIDAPLMRLTYKDKLEWSSGVDQAFQDLKTTFTTAQILIHPDFSKPFFLESDAFDYALLTILSKKRDNKRLHPVAFHSRKFTTVNI